MGVTKYWDLEDEEREKADIDLKKVSVESVIGKKIDRGVEKGLITKEDAEQLEKEISKFISNDMYDWWADQKGKKSFEIATAMFEKIGNASLQELLAKIEKA